MNENIGAVLGKAVDYKLGYNPEVLVKIDRQENRTHLGIDSEDIPFTGFDVWHGYEGTFLVRGIPVDGILKIIIPASSRYTVESKSLKLYLFGFAMDNMADDVASGIVNYETTIRKDLARLLDTNVVVVFHPASKVGLMRSHIVNSHELPLWPARERDARVAYKEDPSLLEVTPTYYDEHRYTYDGLRSNCRVTNQPDYGTVYIEYHGKNFVSPDSLAAYLISFRNENHFHEEIVETIYARLQEALEPNYLNVTAFYTRRGGIDICPTRCSSDRNPFQSTLLDPTFLGKEVRS